MQRSVHGRRDKAHQQGPCRIFVKAIERGHERARVVGKGANRVIGIPLRGKAAFHSRQDFILHDGNRIRNAAESLAQQERLLGSAQVCHTSKHRTHVVRSPDRTSHRGPSLLEHTGATRGRKPPRARNVRCAVEATIVVEKLSSEKRRSRSASVKGRGMLGQRHAQTLKYHSFIAATPFRFVHDAIVSL